MNWIIFAIILMVLAVAIVLYKVIKNFYSYRDMGLEYIIGRFNIPRDKIYKTK